MSEPAMDEDTTVPKLRSRWVKVVGWSLGVLAALFAVVVALRLAVFDLTTIDGDDMWPTIGPRALLLVNRRATPERGDLVVYKGKNDKWQIRRVVALPGEKIIIEHARPTISGLEVKHEEARRTQVYGREFVVWRETIGGRSWEVLDDTMRRFFTREHVVKEGYYVLADHREYGRDSTEDGDVPRERIRGVVTWVIRRGEVP